MRISESDFDNVFDNVSQNQKALLILINYQLCHKI